MIFDISIFRVIIAVIFILIGVKILIGKPFFHSEGDDNHVIFRERTYKSMPVHNSEYNTVFGKTVYDFRNMDSLSSSNTKVKYNTVFGSTKIILPPDLPVHIKADAFFAAARLPSGNTVAFGSANYNSESSDTSTSRLNIVASVVFGELDIQQ